MCGVGAFWALFAYLGPYPRDPINRGLYGPAMVFKWVTWGGPGKTRVRTETQNRDLRGRAKKEEG